MTTAGEARQDMNRVMNTLASLRTHFESTGDQSIFRTAVDHAITAGHRVLDYIGNNAEGSDPCFIPPDRDGGPM